MRKRIFVLLAAGAAVFGVAGQAAQAGPGPGGHGLWAAHPAGGWGGARFRGAARGYRAKFHRGALVAAEMGPGSGRYLSESAWFLSDIGGYLADDNPAYPDDRSYGHGYGYSAYSGPATYGYRPSLSYAVPTYRFPHASRRVVVHRGAPNRAIHRDAFRPGRRFAR